MWLKTAAVRKHSNAQNSGEPQAREPLSNGRRRGRHCNLLVHRPFTTERSTKSVSECPMSGGGERERQHLPHHPSGRKTMSFPFRIPSPHHLILN